MTKVEILTMMDRDLDKKIKIQGTQYDRKRKVSKAQLKTLEKLHKQKKSIAEIAKKTGLYYTTVRYNVDPVYRAEHIAKCSGKHTGKDKVTVSNRIAYKRKLVAAGKVSI